MNQDSTSIPHTAKPRQATNKKTEGLRRLMAKQSPTDICRGLVFLGLAYLLGQCSVYFDTRPLGIAFLCAGSSYVWYILIGLSLSAVLSAGALPFGAYFGVYAFVIALRAMLVYLVDKQSPVGKLPFSKKDDRLHVRRDLDMLSEHWRAFRRLLPRPKGTKDLYEDASEYYAASCSMLHNPPTCTEKDPLPTKERTRVIGLSEEDAPTATKLFGENIFLRLLTGCVAGFALGLFGMIWGGFQVYDLLGTLFLLLFVPIAVFLMIPVFSADGIRILFADGFSKPQKRERRMPLQKNKKSTYTAFGTVSVVLLLTVSVYAAKSLSFSFGNGYLGLYAAPAMALFLCLVAARHLGLIPSVIVALFVGVASEPTLVPAYLLTVLLYALLRLASGRIAVWGGYIAAMVWCYLSGGLTGLTQIAPSFLFSLALFFAGERLREAFPVSATVKPYGLGDFAISVANRLRHEAAQRRMSSLSDAFSSLSELFYDLSDQLRRPRESDYKRICEAVFNQNCSACRHRKECNGQACARTEAAMNSILQRLCRHGRVAPEHLPTEFREFCPRAATLIHQINAACARTTEAMLRSEKTEVFAADYEAIATMLGLAARADEEEYQFHKESADRVFEYLSRHGVAIQGVAVCGKRERHITVRGRNFERVQKKIAEIKEGLEKLCGLRLREPVFECEDDYTVMSLSSLPRMTTTYSGSTVPADQDQSKPFPPALTEDTSLRGRYTPPEPCGDHIAIFTNDQAYFYALISDGMGSGPEASFTSDICAIFLEKMLSAGNQAEVSVKMLNNFIRSKNTGSGDECSATVDLMELDLNNGHAIFVKSGAAPTYVVRAGTVYKLHSRTVPIGIFKDSQPQLLRFRMHPGDVIVMVSDGVTHGNDECPWLIDLLSDPLPNSMDSLRLDILKRAITSGSPDDLSAIAVRVEDAQDRT